jgi:heme-degrading monooxygenase HmoA
MHTRLLTFTGATNIDAGVDYLRDEVVPVLDGQHGYRGVSASADRPGAILSILSLWDTEATRAASDGSLGKAREEALKLVGGSLSIENLEQVVSSVIKIPVPGCALYMSRASMDPASVDGNIAFFKDEMLPRIEAAPGFCALRNMVDRQTGRAVVGTIFEDRRSLDAFVAGKEDRRATAAARGISFGESSIRELLLSEMKRFATRTVRSFRG